MAKYRISETTLYSWRKVYHNVGIEALSNNNQWEIANQAIFYDSWVRD